MRLLVSVRSAAEAEAAVEGGADVVDAKEPRLGSLGPVSREALEAIARTVPDTLPISVALGDFSHPAAAATAVLGLPTMERSLPVYLKLGFAGTTDPVAIGGIMRAAVRAAETRAHGFRVVAVAYADHDAAGSAAPSVVADIAARQGAAGVLVDTQTKDGRDLLHWLPRTELDGWLNLVHRRGLTAAIAGSLTGDRIASLAGSTADVLGVRGAVCEGGRDGVVVASLVRAARTRLIGHALQEAIQ